MKKKFVTLFVMLFFSLGMWISVALSQYYVVTINFPVQFVDLPENYSVGSGSVNDIFIQLKGRGWELVKLMLGRRTNFTIPVHKRVGVHKNNLIDYIESNTWLSSTFQVIDIAPSQIEYEIEKTSFKKVRIVPDLRVTFKEGYAIVSGISITPETVEISGPSQILRQIDTIRTLPQQLKEISDDIDLELHPDLIYGVDIPAISVKVHCEVQKIVDKTFTGLPINAINTPPSKELELFPPKIDLVLRGGINKLGRLTNDSISAYIDFWSALRENSRTIEPVIRTPSFTSIIDVKPKTLNYIIKQH
jgi:YbbR-like protein